MSDDLAFAHRLADIADEITRSAFRAKAYAVRTKADGSAVTDVGEGCGVRCRTALGRERPASA